MSQTEHEQTSIIPEDQWSCNAHLRPKSELISFSSLFLVGYLTFLWKNIKGHPMVIILGFWFYRRNNFKDFITYGDGHLGHVTYIIWTNFGSPNDKGCTCNLTWMCPAAWKQMFDSTILRDLRQKSNNHLDLWYSYELMYSLSQLYMYQFSVHRLQ